MLSGVSEPVHIRDSRSFFVNSFGLESAAIADSWCTNDRMFMVWTWDLMGMQS
jgi:hypothetical protein